MLLGRCEDMDAASSGGNWAKAGSRFLDGIMSEPFDSRRDPNARRRDPGGGLKVDEEGLTTDWSTGEASNECVTEDTADEATLELMRDMTLERS